MVKFQTELNSCTFLANLNGGEVHDLKKQEDVLAKSPSVHAADVFVSMLPAQKLSSAANDKLLHLYMLMVHQHST